MVYLIVIKLSVPHKIQELHVEKSHVEPAPTQE